MPDSVIVFVCGVAAHNNVHRLIEGLRAAIAARGRECVDFDIADQPSGQAFRSLAAEGRIGLLVSMNVGLNTLVDKAPWLRETPTFLYMLDHPYAVFPFCEQIIGQFDSVHLSHPSERQAHFADRLHPRPRTTHVLPHAAEAMDEPLPWSERDIAVVFAGNYGLDRELESERADWQRYGEHRAAALEAIVARIDDRSHETLEHAAIDVLAGEENLSAGQVCAYMKVVDMYLRGRVRWRAVQGLADTPGAVVCGDGWDHIAETSTGSATFASATDAAAVQALMRRARIAVNLLPDYYDSHERMFDAAAHGCLLISTESAFLREAFGAEAVHFLAEPEDLANAVAYYTTNPQEAQEKAERGRAVFLAAHTWDHRAADLLRIVGAVRGR